MSERGVFAVDRGIWGHPSFADEPFTEREAWTWMISEAAFRPHSRRIADRQIDLSRGQLAGSIRFLAEKWGWHRSKVERFLTRLKTETMLTVHTKTGITVITVCNYDKYQRVSLPRETPTETPTETVARQSRDKVEDTEDTKKNAAVAAPDPEFDLYRRGKEVLGKTAGGLIRQLLSAKDGKITLARAAIETAAEKENPREYIGRIIRNHDPPQGEASRYVDPRL